MWLWVMVEKQFFSCSTKGDRILHCPDKNMNQEMGLILNAYIVKCGRVGSGWIFYWVLLKIWWQPWANIYYEINKVTSIVISVMLESQKQRPQRKNAHAPWVLSQEMSVLNTLWLYFFFITKIGFQIFSPMVLY